MHSRWFDLLATLGGAAFVADARSLRVSFVSDELLALSGCTHERWLADPPLLPELIHADDRKRVLTAFREASVDSSRLVEMRLVDAGGAPHRYRAAVRLDPGGQLQALLLDITTEREADRPVAVSLEELRHAQAALVQRERLAALGELAAVVAHEVRNPLGAIYSSLGTLRRMVRLDGESALLFDILQEEATRLNRLTVELLDWVRPLRPETRPQLLAPILDRALQAARRLAPPPAPAPVEVDITFAPDLPRVPIDEQLFPMALVNVLANALQSMPRGGRLRIDARPTTDAEQRWLSIAVSDTGPGIPPEIIGRIFEPFVTTRATGTGLGLALAKRILDGHGGAIDVESAPGQGATFTLRLPLAVEPV